MKKLLICLATLAIIASVGVMRAEAADTDTITVTVTLRNISVSVTPETWAIGTVAPGANKSSWVFGAAGYFTAANDGNVNENFTIAASNTTSGNWTVDTTAAVNKFAIGYGHNTVIESPDLEPTYTTFTSAGALVSSVAPAGTDKFDLRFTAPSSTSIFNAAGETFTVTVTASASA